MIITWESAREEGDQNKIYQVLWEIIIEAFLDSEKGWLSMDSFSSRFEEEWAQKRVLIIWKKGWHVKLHFTDIVGHKNSIYKIVIRMIIYNEIIIKIIRMWRKRERLNLDCILCWKFSRNLDVVKFLFLEPKPSPNFAELCEEWLQSPQLVTLGLTNV